MDKIVIHKRYTCTLLFLLLISSSAFSLAHGQMSIPIRNVLYILLNNINPEWGVGCFTAEQAAVIWHIRMPRTIIGLLSGGGLAIAGAAMQGIFSNPLSEPGVIGVSSGAATGAVIAIALGLASQSVFYIPIFAFTGAIAALSMTFLLAVRNGRIPVSTLLLSGIAVGMFLGAVTSGLLTFLHEQKLQQYIFWMVGSLDYRSWEDVQIAIVPILTAAIIIIILARHLNILLLGEVEAQALGMRVGLYRIIILLCASLITAISVCVSGNIGFVGLIVPHALRILVGSDHRLLLPCCLLTGATFLVFCDTIGRTILAYAEIRVGIVTALLGAPYFLYLLRSMRNTD